VSVFEDGCDLGPVPNPVLGVVKPNIKSLVRKVRKRKKTYKEAEKEYLESLGPLSKEERFLYRTTMKNLYDRDFQNIVSEIMELGFKVNKKGCLVEVPSAEEITIPEKVGSIKVLSIGEAVCKDRSDIVSVTIPEGDKFIDYEAFKNCSSLKRVSLPESLEEIGESAFAHCSSLRKVRIPSNVSSVGMSVFSNCGSLSEVLVPKDLSLIGKGLFVGCASLKREAIKRSSPVNEMKKVKELLDEAEKVLLNRGINSIYDYDEVDEANVSTSLVKKIAKEVSELPKEDPNIDDEDDALGKCFDVATKMGKKDKEALEIAREASKEVTKNRK